MKKNIVSCLVLLAFAPFGLFAATQRTARSQTSGQVSAAPVAARAAARGGVVGTTATAPKATGTVAARSATRTVAAAPVPSSGVTSARAASTQKVIQTGSAQISGAASNAGVVSEECKEKYFGCMDSFCMQDNANGARCVCSDQVKTYNAILAEIEKLDEQSLKLATDGVARIDMGEKAGEIDKMVNAATNAVESQTSMKSVSSTAPTTRKRRTLDLDAFNKIGFEDEYEELVVEKDPLEGLTGTALGDGVRAICLKQVQAGCQKDMTMLQMMYATQIKSDCAGYELELKKRRTASVQKLSTAQRAMKEAALEAFEAQNKWDLGQCMTEMRKCVVTTGKCGEDFSNCTFYNTGEGLSGSSTLATVPGSKIRVGQGTIDSVQSKRKLCEASIVKNCVAVKEQVWPAFLEDIAPQLKSAELIAENNQRQNTLGNIADCFVKACKDNMDPNDPDGSYDACLGNPATMARFCKVVMDQAGVQPTDTDEVWGFVKARLGAMRVDACTMQVKNCLSADTACGENYTACVGLDLEDVKAMCPAEKLTGCMENGVMKASISEIDNMVRGIFLNVDNKLQEACELAAQEAMTTVCGDVTSCGAFDEDEVMGSESLYAAPKNAAGDVTIKGLINYAVLSPKKEGYGFDINAYLGEKAAANIDDLKYVQYGLTAFNNKVNGVVNSLMNNSTVKNCVQGRDTKQIMGDRGEGRNRSEARFPHLLDSYVNYIYSSAVRVASANYDKKLGEIIADSRGSVNEEQNRAFCSSMASGNTFNYFAAESAGGGRDQYGITYTIPGASITSLKSAPPASETDWVVVNAKGTLVASISASSEYSPANQVCSITTTSTPVGGSSSSLTRRVNLSSESSEK